jgi:hypothetical protein
MCTMSPPPPNTLLASRDSLPSISNQPGKGGYSPDVFPTHAAPAGSLRI